MIDKKTFKFSIIIPCYNEKKTIENILKKLMKVYKITKFQNMKLLL